MKARFGAVALFLVGVVCLAQAQEGRPSGPNPSAVGQAVTGQIPGTVTNDNANAGNIGETISAPGFAANQTVTFTNGSAVIADSGTCAAGYTTANSCMGVGSVVNFTTSGTLPTNFTVGTDYWVIATGFTAGSSYEVSTTPTGSAVVAGSAGTGTQTRVNSDIGTLTNAFGTVAAVSLTPGQWQCSGAVFVDPSGSSTTQQGFIGTTHDSGTGFIAATNWLNNISLSNVGTIHSTGNVTIKVASQTEFYLEGGSTFSTGALTMQGALSCTRQR